MAVPLIQQAFSAGEISPELYGEVSLAKYSSALTTGRNMVVNYKGGAFSRGGLATVGVSLQSTYLRLGTSTGPPRPIPFQFNNNQGYVLEFGDQYLRFIFQGGYVLEAAVNITSASQANPCQVGVVGTPFSNNDWVFFAGVGGMTELNGNTYIVAGVAAGHFTLKDLQGNPVDSTAFTAYTAGGTVSRLYTVSTPYAAVDLPYLKYAQSTDVMSLTCVNPVTLTEYLPYDLTRLSATDWTLTQSNFDSVIAAPATVSAVSNSVAPTSGINATFSYVVTAVDANGNESVASAPTGCHGADIEVEGGTNIVSWSMSAGAKFYNVYRAPASVDTGTGGTATPNPVPLGSIYGFAGSSYGAQYADSASTVDLSQTPPTHHNPFAPGQILAVDITDGGSGLDTVTWSVTTGTGTGFNGFPVLAGGSLGAFPITDNGENYAPGDSIAFNGAGFASGAISFGANPTAGDTITLNGLLWTFVSAITAPNQTVIQGALSTTLRVLVSDLSASSDAALIVANYGVDITQAKLLITYATAGVAGNSYTLGASAGTPSGGTLTGGSGTSIAGTKATGNLLFGAGNPAAGQNIVLDGVAWTFVAAGAIGTQTNIKATLALTLTQLQTDLTASANATIQLANYTVDATHLFVQYKVVGTVGNSYTLGAGTAGTTPSGATLTGGLDAGSTPTATLDIGPTSGTYPGVVAYFQQRKFFADSLNNPDTVWASQTGRYSNFDFSIPTIATDAITASPWTEQVNGIQWLVPMPGGLIAMTGLRAWQIIGEGTYQLNVQPVTPSTTQAQPQAFNGCAATIPPIVIDYDVIYVEAIGNTTVRDLSWNFWVNIYTGADLTILSSHLFLYRQIVQWTWARNPYKVLWACCNDGTLLSMTYLKEQEVYGWTRGDTQGLVVGITSITEPPVNAVYAAVQRFPPYAANGIYVMERMDNRIWQSVEDAYAVDSGVSNPLSYPNAALSATTTAGAVTFNADHAVFTAGSVGQVIRMGGGIATVTSYTNSQQVLGTWNLGATAGPTGFPYVAAGTWSIATPVGTLYAPHLAGMSVMGLADGVPFGPVTVAANGAIAIGFMASNVKAGLPFLAQAQTPYLNGQQVTQGARKMIPAASIRVAASATFQYGTNQPDGAAQNPPQLGPAWGSLATADPLKPTGGQLPAPSYTSPGGQTVTQLWTGDIRVVGQGAGWQSKGQVAVQQSLPMALEVTAVEPEVLPGDIPEVAYREQQGQGGQQARPPGRWMLGGGPRI